MLVSSSYWKLQPECWYVCYDRITYQLYKMLVMIARCNSQRDCETSTCKTSVNTNSFQFVN